jgi:hypothetical protein
MQVFNFYLSLHHQNSRIENISFLFCLPLFNSVAQKIILNYKKYWGWGICPPLAPPKLHLWLENLTIDNSTGVHLMHKPAYPVCKAIPMAAA